MAFKVVRSNTNKGRHAVGSPVGKFTPNRASNGPSGNYGVGTGRNQKTAGRANYQGTQPRSGTDAQPEAFINQAPSPWDNSQPSSNPTTGAPSTNPTPGGTWRQLMSQPGQHPFRAPGRSVPTQSAINSASGHKQGYQPAGQGGRSVISGYPQRAPKKNIDNGGQPRANTGKTNQDIFGPDSPGMKEYAKRDGKMYGIFTPKDRS